MTENSSFPNVSLYEIEMNYSNVRSGGQWSPSHCRARHRVNIFISIRLNFIGFVLGRSYNSVSRSIRTFSHITLLFTSDFTTSRTRL